MTKKIKRRLLSVLLAVSIVTAPIMGITAGANPDEIGVTSSGFHYRISNGKAIISEYLGNSTIADIPSSINGYRVTEISSIAFPNASWVTSIIIPEGVTTMHSSFSKCSSLTSIIIPESLTNFLDNSSFSGADNLTSAGVIGSGCSYQFGWKKAIPSWAFSGCSKLSKIDFPESVTSIGEFAFNGCHSLNSITIPKNVTSIGKYAFTCCTNLKSVTMPEKITGIESHTFNQCHNLTNITIPESVTYIGCNAFQACSSLTSINIPKGVKNINSSTFILCKSLENITIPESVTNIGSYAFAYCDKLTNVTIPNSVTYIDSSAFYGSPNLTINCNKNSYAHKYAISKNISYKIIGGTTDFITTNHSDLSFNVFSVSNRFKYIEGATITIDNVGNATTDSSGNAAIHNNISDIMRTEKVTIKKAGYRDYVFYKDIYNSGVEIITDNNYDVISLKALKDGDATNSYISTVMYYPRYKRAENLLDYSYTFQLTDDASNICSFRICGVMKGASATEYSLYQIGGKSYTNNTGIFSLNMSKAFDAGKKVYAKIKASDGTVIVEETKIIVQKMNSTTTPANAVDLIESDSSGSLPSELALLSGVDFKLSLKGMSFTSTVENNKVKVAFGVDTTKGTNNSIFSNKEWNEWKKNCNEIAGSNIKDVKNKIQNLKMSFDAGIKGDIKAIGYAEGTVNANGETIVKGKVKITANLDTSIETPYVVGVVPVFVKVTMGATGGVDSSAIAFNLTKKEFVKNSCDMQFSFEPHLIAEAGVGVSAVASISVEGSGKLPINAKLPAKPGDSNTSVKATTEMKLKLKCLFYESSLSLAKKTWTLIPKSNSNDLSTAMNLFVNPSPTAGFTISDRNEAESEWNGLKEELSRASVGSAERVLEENVYGDSEPKLIKAGDTKMLLWVDDDKERSSANRTKLMYSIYDENTDKWSNPEAVCDDGTADFAPEAVADGENIYLTWQNIGKTLEDTASLDDVAKESEVCYSKWTKEGGFEDKIVVSKAGLMSVTPKICLNSNGKPIVAYLQNTANNILMSTGENNIEYTVINGASIEKNTYKQNVGFVQSLSIGYTDKLNVAYTIDVDNDSSTIEDREVVLDDYISENEVIDSNPKFVNISGEQKCVWYQDGNLIIKNTDGTDEVIYSHEGSSLSDDYEVIEGVNTAAIIWSKTDDNDTKQVCGITYDTEANKWTEEIDVSDADWSIYKPNGIILEDETIELSYIKKNGETAKLCLCEKEKLNDLVIQEAYVDESTLNKGELGKINVVVKNEGIAAAKDYSIKVGETVTNYTTVINPGETVELEADYDVPEDFTYGNVGICVSSDMESDVSNNNYDLLMGHSDLSLYLDDKCGDDAHVVDVQVENLNPVSTDAVLKVLKNSEDGEEIDSIELGNVEKDSISNMTYVYEPDEDTEIVFFKVESSIAEKYTEDNSDFIDVYLPTIVEETNPSEDETTSTNNDETSTNSTETTDSKETTKSPETTKSTETTVTETTVTETTKAPETTKSPETIVIETTSAESTTSVESTTSAECTTSVDETTKAPETTSAESTTNVDETTKSTETSKTETTENITESSKATESIKPSETSTENTTTLSEKVTEPNSEDETTEIHSMIKHDMVEPTCSEIGHKEYYSCSTCKKYFTDKAGKNEVLLDQIVIPAKNHSIIKINAKNPTDNTLGNIEYYECQECHKYFKDENGNDQITDKESVIVRFENETTKETVENESTTDKVTETVENESTSNKVTEKETIKAEETTVDKTAEEETTTLEQKEENTTVEEETTLEQKEENTTVEETTQKQTESQSKTEKSLTLNKTKYSIVVGGKFTLKATYKNVTKNKTIKTKYTWKSSNSKVVKVSKSGVITGVKAGTAKITVKTSDGRSKTCEVTVKKAPKSISLNKTKLSLKKGKTFKLTYKITKNTYTNVVFSTSNKKIVKISQNGKIKALKKGNVTIKAKTSNGKVATCKVTVK